MKRVKKLVLTIATATAMLLPVAQEASAAPTGAFSQAVHINVYSYSQAFSTTCGSVGVIVGLYSPSPSTMRMWVQADGQSTGSAKIVNIPADNRWHGAVFDQGVVKGNYNYRVRFQVLSGNARADGFIFVNPQDNADGNCS